MKKLAALLVFLLSATPAFAGPPDDRVERIKASLRFKPVFAQTISKLQIADFLGVTSATAGCAPSGQARAFYDPTLNLFKVLDSSCNLVIASGGAAWNTLLNPNGNAAPNFGGTSFVFSNGNWDWGTMNLFVPGTPGFSPSSTRQLGFDTTAGNLLFNNGAPAYVPLLPTANAVNPGDLASFQISGGGQLTLASASVNSNTGTSTVQMTATNPALRDTPCITSLGPPLVFDNCTPGIPINLQSGTTYAYTSDDRGVGVISNNASAQAYSLPLLSEDNGTAANFFWFQLSKNTGTITITATEPNIFDSTGTANENIFEGENVSFLTDDSTGKIYPKISPGRISVSPPIVQTRSPYGTTLSCPTCGTTGGTLTSPHLPVATGGATLADSTVTDDGTAPTRAPKGANTATEGNYEEYTVDTGGVTAGLALCVTANTDGNGRPKVLPCNHLATQPGAGFVGIAKTSVAAAGTVAVCWTVNCSATFDNTSVALHEAILSVTTDGRLHDSGAQTATAGQPNFAVLNANGGVGTNALISLTGMLAQNPNGGGNNGNNGTFPDVKIIPAANCPNATAGSGWSYAAAVFTAACRAGTNNLGGALQQIPATGGAAQFRIELPLDWKTSQQPYIRIEYGSGANTSGTVIWTVASACTKADGSVTDDPSFNSESAFGTQTMAAANRAWSQTGQYTAITSGNNCVPGGGLILRVTLSGTAASAINVYQAVVTIPRNTLVQAN